MLHQEDINKPTFWIFKWINSGKFRFQVLKPHFIVLFHRLQANPGNSVNAKSGDGWTESLHSGHKGQFQELSFCVGELMKIPGWLGLIVLWQFVTDSNLCALVFLRPTIKVSGKTKKISNEEVDVAYEPTLLHMISNSPAVAKYTMFSRTPLCFALQGKQEAILSPSDSSALIPRFLLEQKHRSQICTHHQQTIP